MVRFQVSVWHHTCAGVMCFNSKMVRFQGNGNTRIIPINGSFNSKMVRFQGAATNVISCFILCFNSKMVRFQGCRFTECDYYQDLFQFQNGAIPRIFQQLSWRSIQGFNSKMVRFQEEVANIARALKNCFNSKMVRFQEIPAVYHSRSLPGFNSKMVRFQEKPNPTAEPPLSVSIPKWCDSKPLCSTERICLSYVSIPKWCDSKAVQDRATET